MTPPLGVKPMLVSIDRPAFSAVMLAPLPRWAMTRRSGTSAPIQKLAAERQLSEDIFFELALEDVTLAADLFRSTFDASGGDDGWVSLEVSPLLANDTAGTIQAAARLHARAARPNLFIKIPGTPKGLPAIEQSIFNGVPINVTHVGMRRMFNPSAYAAITPYSMPL